MRTSWLSRLVALLLLFLAGPLSNAPRARGAADTWSPAAPMTVARSGHTATRLMNGQVLVAGGQSNQGITDSAELYDPAADRWFPAGRMTAPRTAHTATLLPNGQVLVVGGFNDSVNNNTTGLASAERYDPTSNSWTPVASMSTWRTNHIALLLRDGRVLVIGSARPGIGAEVYDPATDRWTLTGPMQGPSTGVAAALLSDGSVLVTGGADGEGGVSTSAERYNPTTNDWTATAPLKVARAGHTATTLPDGQVLVVGGVSLTPGGGGSFLASVERYDPATGAWTEATPLNTARASHAAVLLPNDRLLVLGGNGASGRLASVERYYPDTDRWQIADALHTARSAFTATVLDDGQVLVAGGYIGTANRLTTLATTERYAAGPPSTPWCFSETGKCVGGRFLAYWQAHGGLALNGYPLTEPFTQTLEDGKSYTVQYFERVRLEEHPENSPPWDVELGQFGRRILAGVPNAPTATAAPKAGETYYPETGHNLGGGFRDYWQANGSLMQFGYPLTEEFTQTLEDGKTYTVQYFERARFEYHPENAPPWEIELGQFGRRILAETNAGR